MDIDTLFAKQEITEVLHSYCRSLDRMDVALFETLFVPGAHLDYGEHFSGTAEEFRPWVWGSHELMVAHAHMVTNVLIDVDLAAGTAVSECYVSVCLRTDPERFGSSVDLMERGRYLDRWSNADGTWRIATRRYVADLAQTLDASSFAPPTAARDASDPSYQLGGSRFLRR